jgi:elongation factor Ts
MDCKKALTEANGDMEAAMEILRKKGQLVAAKRSDREAAEGCVLAKVDGNFGVMVALKCETDFVAKNADFVALANAIIDAALANKCKNIEEVNALPMGNGTVADAITERSGVTGEKMELDVYAVVEGEQIVAYNHMAQNFLCALVAFNKNCSEEYSKGVAMQVAAMAPIALDESAITEEAKAAELKAIIEKTKEDEVKKAIEVAIKKAGINPNHVDSDDHISSNITKGYITEEQGAQAREIIATVGEEARKNLNDKKIEMIAQGRLNKYYKEVCLLNQAYIDDNKITVAQYLQNADKELTVTDFKRYTLRAE